PALVLLTHLLPGNTVGLDDLLGGAWLAGRRTPLRLIGPRGTAALAQHVVSEISDGVVARARALGEDPSPPAIDAVDGPIGDLEGPGYSLLGPSLPGGPLPTLAWRIQTRGHSAVIGGYGWGGAVRAQIARG